MDEEAMAEIIGSITNFRSASWLHLPFTNDVMLMAASLWKGDGRSDSRFK